MTDSMFALLRENKLTKNNIKVFYYFSNVLMVIGCAVITGYILNNFYLGIGAGIFTIIFYGVLPKFLDKIGRMK